MHFGPTASSTSPSATTRTAPTRRRSATASARSCGSTTDGSIPSRTPFYNTATGANRAIWALGLRNPFTFAFQPGSARMFINDVGQNTWEEINDGIAGSNYGWPDTEGPTTDPRFRVADLLRTGTGARDDRLRDHRRRVLQPADRAVPERVRRRLLLRRLLHGLDPQARPGERQHGHGLRERDRQPRRPRGRERRQPLLPRARLRRRRSSAIAYTASQAPTITTHPSNQTVPVGGVGDVHRRGQRDAAARVPVAAKRRRHPGATSRATRSPGARRPTTARGSARASRTAPAAPSATRRR